MLVAFLLLPPPKILATALNGALKTRERLSLFFGELLPDGIFGESSVVVDNEAIELLSKDAVPYEIHGKMIKPESRETTTRMRNTLRRFSFKCSRVLFTDVFMISRREELQPGV
ncbi:MAG: hypothetical protein H0W76_01175 [Pyrinomonadaceae bacterium]|nr:hypothetical protein [Pyrinomonadaceae bacterium]